MDVLFEQSHFMSQYPGFLPQQGVNSGMMQEMLMSASEHAEPMQVSKSPSQQEYEPSMHASQHEACMAAMDVQTPLGSGFATKPDPAEGSLLQSMIENPISATFVSAQVKKLREPVNLSNSTPANNVNSAKPMKRKKFRPKDRLDQMQRHLESVISQMEDLSMINRELHLKKKVLEIVMDSSKSYEALAAQAAKDLAEFERDPSQPAKGAARYKDISPVELAEVYNNSISEYSKWVMNSQEGEVLSPEVVERLQQLTIDTINTTRYAVIMCPHIILHVNRRLRKMSPMKATTEEEHLMQAVASMEMTDKQEEYILMGHQIFGRCVDNLNVEWQKLLSKVQATIASGQVLAPDANGPEDPEEPSVADTMAGKLRQMAGLQLVICTFMYEKVFEPMQTVRLFLHGHPLLPRCVWDMMNIMRKFIMRKRGIDSPAIVPVHFSMQNTPGSTLTPNSAKSPAAKPAPKATPSKAQTSARSPPKSPKTSPKSSPRACSKSSQSGDASALTNALSSASATGQSPPASSDAPLPPSGPGQKDQGAKPGLRRAKRGPKLKQEPITQKPGKGLVLTLPTVFSGLNTIHSTQHANPHSKPSHGQLSHQGPSSEAPPSLKPHTRTLNPKQPPTSMPPPPSLPSALPASQRHQPLLTKRKAVPSPEDSQPHPHPNSHPSHSMPHSSRPMSKGFTHPKATSSPFPRPANQELTNADRSFDAQSQPAVQFRHGATCVPSPFYHPPKKSGGPHVRPTEPPRAPPAHPPGPVPPQDSTDALLMSFLASADYTQAPPPRPSTYHNAVEPALGGSMESSLGGSNSVDMPELRSHELKGDLGSPREEPDLTNDYRSDSNGYGQDFQQQPNTAHYHPHPPALPTKGGPPRNSFDNPHHSHQRPGFTQGASDRVRPAGTAAGRQSGTGPSTQLTSSFQHQHAPHPHDMPADHANHPRSAHSMRSPHGLNGPGHSHPHYAQAHAHTRSHEAMGGSMDNVMDPHHGRDPMDSMPNRHQGHRGAHTHVHPPGAHTHLRQQNGPHPSSAPLKSHKNASPFDTAHYNRSYDALSPASSHLPPQQPFYPTDAPTYSQAQGPNTYTKPNTPTTFDTTSSSPAPPNTFTSMMSPSRPQEASMPHPDTHYNSGVVRCISPIDHPRYPHGSYSGPAHSDPSSKYGDPNAHPHPHPYHHTSSPLIDVITVGGDRSNPSSVSGDYGPSASANTDIISSHCVSPSPHSHPQYPYPAGNHPLSNASSLELVDQLIDPAYGPSSYPDAANHLHRTSSSSLPSHRTSATSLPSTHPNQTNPSFGLDDFMNMTRELVSNERLHDHAPVPPTQPRQFSDKHPQHAEYHRDFTSHPGHMPGHAATEGYEAAVSSPGVDDCGVSGNPELSGYDPCQNGGGEPPFIGGDSQMLSFFFGDGAEDDAGVLEEGSGAYATMHGGASAQHFTHCCDGTGVL